MLVRRVIFPDTVPWVRSKALASVASLGVTAHVATKLPDPAAGHRRIVQIRNDSGQTLDMLKIERYGVNVYAPTVQEAGLIARTISADIVAGPDGTPVVAAAGGTGPYEIADDEDALDDLAHVYFTVELTVRGTSR